MALQSDDASVQKCEGETIRMATKIGVNRDRLNLKGILKSTFDNTPSCYIDFNNECTISNELNKSQSHYHNRLDFLSEISGSETLTSRRMERNETDFSEERLRPQLKVWNFLFCSNLLSYLANETEWVNYHYFFVRCILVVWSQNVELIESTFKIECVGENVPLLFLILNLQ